MELPADPPLQVDQLAGLPLELVPPVPVDPHLVYETVPLVPQGSGLVHDLLLLVVEEVPFLAGHRGLRVQGVPALDQALQFDLRLLQLGLLFPADHAVLPIEEERYFRNGN